jgi:DNA/RNA-binding domain of Phe-tRNA-synthetase-like protein
VVWKIYSGLTIRKRNKTVDEWIHKHQLSVKQKYRDKDWRKRLSFSGYIRLHDRFAKTKGMISSPEKMIRFVLKEGAFPRINAFVDIYNIVSALTGVSIGAHDVRKIAGDVCLKVLEKDTPFEVIGGGRYSIAWKGEYGYTDDDGIICRLDIKQAEKTKVTEMTRDAFVIFQGHADLGEEILRQAVHLFEEGIRVLTDPP